MPVAFPNSFQNQLKLMEHEKCPSPEVVKTVSKKRLPTQTKRLLPDLAAVKQSVTFHERVTVYLVPHALELDDDEFAASWYQKDEFQTIRQDMHAAVKALSNGTFTSDNDDQCKRGLEPRTKQGSRRRRIKKQYARVSVLEEQERQRSLGINNPEALRKAYIHGCQDSRETAVAFGQADAEAAALVYFLA
mmetsp:Transcript_2084/g.4920  ORF Transcript_2084/g.4920 Transcript_2084/m.4920 type:complete len:190 (-) Transcript_2084:39-608(-)